VTPALGKAYAIQSFTLARINALNNNAVVSPWARKTRTKTPADEQVAAHKTQLHRVPQST
jgi:hypothetical protein